MTNCSDFGNKIKKRESETGHECQNDKQFSTAGIRLQLQVGAEEKSYIENFN